MATQGRPSKDLKRNYYRLWWHTIVFFELKPAEALLMFLIDSLSRNTDWCYASKKTLARILNITEPTVYKHLKKLLDKRLIIANRDPHGIIQTWKPANEKQAYALLHGKKVVYLRPTEEWQNLIYELSGPIANL